MTGLSIVVLFFGSLIVILLLALIAPVHCVFYGTWREKAAGRLAVRIGPAEMEATWTGDSGSRITARVIGLRVVDREVTGSKKEKETTREKKRDGFSPADSLVFMDRQFIRSLAETMVRIIKSAAPRVLETKGFLGFGDPYYTGLFAAVRSVVPGIGIEPDFTREVHDISAKLEGRIILIVLLFHAGRFIISKEARPVLKKMLRRKKAQKFATGTGSPVYR
ncbi:MAG: hypothetical protein QHH10_11195 [Peptococcaceae bacterium]|jgi:hypothetical protein|nr:hypothetical protein [Peptococcaceae bacterium]MDH7525865.1 hypothetical protein [Peptococcaceae bacterium]